VNLVEPSRLKQLLAEGRITSSEYMSRVVQGATKWPPECIAPCIPAGVLEEIRNQSEHPPKCLEESPRIFAIGMTAGAANEARRLWFEGILKWHDFFHRKCANLHQPGSNNSESNKAE
jgi:hypothetical protein